MRTINKLVVILAVMNGTLVPLGAAENSVSVSIPGVEKIIGYLSGSKTQLADVRVMDAALFTALAVQQAGLPADTTGATLRVKDTPASAFEYQAFVKWEVDVDPLFVAINVAHEGVHLVARKKNLPYTSQEEARAMAAGLAVFQEALGKEAFKSLKKRLDKLVLAGDMGGGWQFVQATDAAADALLVAANIALTPRHKKEASNLVLVMMNDQDKLAVLLGQSRVYGKLFSRN
jgi:hypothetical protein